jgi:hypothetical protein
VHRPGFNPADIDAGEQLLCRFAGDFGPKELNRLAHQVIDAINPDGSRPKDELNHDRRFLHLRPTRDGAYTGEFRLTGQAGVKLAALLQPLTKPRINTATGPDGQLVEQPDPRRADSPVPDTGGTPATVIITIDVDDLLNRTGYGVAADGTLIPTDTVRQMTDQAEVYTAFLTSRGEVLRLGRSRRIASRSQTIALTARDGGCSFPGCDTPPEWCERHHVVSWIEGGMTDLHNLTLLCRYHHHNFAAKSWDCAINSNGLPSAP